MSNMNDFRIMGRWTNYKDFVVVFGRSEWDCKNRLLDAMSAYTRKDLENIEYLWMEFWVICKNRPSYWSPIKDVSVFQLKLLATAGKESRGEGS